MQSLVQLIFDIDMMKQTMLEMEIDVAKMPLGKLSRRNLKTGVRTLPHPLTTQHVS